MNAPFLLAFAAVGTAFAPRTAAAPFFEKQNLFEEKTNNFVSYRIPGVIVTNKGTVLCFHESGRGPQAPGTRLWPYAFLTLARFNLEWLTAGSTARATTRP